MQFKKTVAIVFSLVVIVFLSLWLIKNSVLFKDEVSSRAKKVWLPIKISNDYYG